MSVSNEWELSKENILPIMGGRKAGALRTGLSIHPEDQLQQKRKAFEQQLRIYDGDDPLSVWCEYIKWVEQNYLKGGKDSSLNKLVQQCLSILKDEEKYQDDERFIDIWLKFAQMSLKPVEVYRNMYERKIGCKSAKFFIAWAWEVEQLGNLKRADEIMLEGIHRYAQPIEDIKLAHRKLEARLVQAFAAGMKKEPNAEPEYRSAFTLLKTQEKNKAPIVRVGPMTLTPSHENLIIGHKQPQPKKPFQNNQKVPFKIFNSENVSPVPVPNETVPAFVLNTENAKENEKRPSKWSKVKVPSAANAVKLKAPEFTVHSDDTPQPSSVRKGSTPERVLTQWTKPVNRPVALFEPPNPNTRVMYDKMKVYGGTKEYSFEEIRAAIWFDKQKKLEEEKRKIEEEREKQELREQLKMLQQKIVELESKTTQPSNSKNSAGDAVGQCTKNSPQAFQQTRASNEVNSETSQKSSSELVGDMLGLNTFNPDNSHQSSSTTTLVRNMFQDLYAGTKCNSIRSDSASDLPQEKLQEVYLDNAKTIQKTSGCTVVTPVISDDIQEDNVKKNSGKQSAFTIYCDPNGENQPEPHLLPFELYRDVNSQQHQEDVRKKVQNFVDNEDIENVPPADYIQVFEKRELCGVLQPSKDIPFIPLEQQLENYDEVEEDYDEVLAQPFPAGEDVTMVPPLSTTHFAMAPHFASTPCVKSIPEQNPEALRSDHQNTLQQIDDDNKILILTLQDCLSINRCSRTKELIINALEKIVNVKTSQTKDTDLKRASDCLQTCIQINKDPNLISYFSCAASLMETFAEKIRASISKPEPQSAACAAQQSCQLSTIMENSREGSAKSCSSNSSIGSVSRTRNFSIYRSSLMDSAVKSHPAAIAESLNESSTAADIKSSILTFEKDNCHDANAIEICIFDCNPFSDDVTNSLLNEVNPPITSWENYYVEDQKLIIRIGGELKLGDITCFIESQFASGAHAKIYSATIIVDNVFQETQPSQEEHLALKVCRNTNAWEFYICSALRKRLLSSESVFDVSNSVMEMRSAVSFNKSVVLVSKLMEYGTILDVVNLYKIRLGQVPECIALYFTWELLLIVSNIHECSILHCDIKPDNILINGIQPAILINNLLDNKTSCLRLIDFGRAIDLSFFNPGIAFTTTLQKQSFQCMEMREGLPWVHQLDWYGVMGCIHVLLFNDYMTIEKNSSGEFMPKSKFKRYWQVDIWQPLFQTFLNMPSCYKVPDVKPFLKSISDVLQKQSRNFISQMRELSSILPTKL